jgi:hypothetical protein
VEDFLSRERNLKAEAAGLYEDTFSIEQIQSAAICLGMVVPHALFDFDPEQVDRFDQTFPPDRIAELHSGSKPTAQEVQLYRKCILAEAEGGDCDADLIPGFWIHRLRHRDGREVYALTTAAGYSFSGITSHLEGLFESEESALNSLSSIGVAVDITRRVRSEKSRGSSRRPVNSGNVH